MMVYMCTYAWDCVWEIHTLRLSRPEGQKQRIKYAGAINTPNDTVHGMGKNFQTT